MFSLHNYSKSKCFLFFVKENEWIRDNVIAPYWLEREKANFPFTITSTEFQSSNDMTCNNW